MSNKKDKESPNEWKFNKEALAATSKFELECLHGLFLLYDSSLVGDKLSSINLVRFTTLLSDAGVLNSQSFSLTSAEEVYAKTILSKLRTYLDVDGNPALTFGLFVGAIMRVAIAVFPEVSHQDAQQQLIDQFLLPLATRLSTVQDTENEAPSSLVTVAGPANWDPYDSIGIEPGKTFPDKSTAAPSSYPDDTETATSTSALPVHRHKRYDSFSLQGCVDKAAIVPHREVQNAEDRQVAAANTIPQDLQSYFPSEILDTVMHYVTNVFAQRSGGHVLANEIFSLVSSITDNMSLEEIHDVMHLIQVISKEHTFWNVSNVLELLAACPTLRYKTQSGEIVKIDNGGVVLERVKYLLKNPEDDDMKPTSLEPVVEVQEQPVETVSTPTATSRRKKKKKKKANVVQHTRISSSTPDPVAIMEKLESMSSQDCERHWQNSDEVISEKSSAPPIKNLKAARKSKIIMKERITPPSVVVSSAPPPLPSPKKVKVNSNTRLQNRLFGIEGKKKVRQEDVLPSVAANNRKTSGTVILKSYPSPSKNAASWASCITLSKRQDLHTTRAHQIEKVQKDIEWTSQALLKASGIKKDVV